VGRPSEDRTAAQNASEESTLTVIVAGLANLAIAVAKAIAGVLSGSSAVLAEAAHSLADTLTEVLLFVALRRGAAPPDERHPFGHGKRSYVWALLAAFGTLILGAGFAVIEGIRTIVFPVTTGDFLITYIVLVISFVFEAISLARALSQLRGTARRWRAPVLRYLRRTPDTALKAVTLEDSGALVGLVLAGAGVGLTEFTGNSVWDGVASICIGVLLAVIGVTLIRTNVSLVVGEATSSRLRRDIRRELEQVPDVDQVLELLTMYLGPQSLLVAARISFVRTSSVAELTRAADEAERRLRERFPLITQLFLDPTPRPDGGADTGARPIDAGPDTL
jgi:cation diffusion facilitator family transporter